MSIKRRLDQLERCAQRPVKILRVGWDSGGLHYFDTDGNAITKAAFEVLRTSTDARVVVDWPKQERRNAL